MKAMGIAAGELSRQVAGVTVNENYREHRRQLLPYIKNKDRLIFIAHSQGNIFANKAYAFVDEEKADLPTMIHIASPTSVVHGDETIADKDKVIAGMMRRNSLPQEGLVAIPDYEFRPAGDSPSPGESGETDSWGHAFLAIYLVDFAH